MNSICASFLWYVAIIFLPAATLLLVRWKKSPSRRLPPGPPGWPVFGHMFSLGNESHRTLAGLKEKYGPVIWLRIGSINTMVILTSQAAAEFFKKQDTSFADRMIVETMRSHDFHKSSLSLAPYGSYWRLLRRLCTLEMFTQKKMNETMGIKQKCVDDMLARIKKEANDAGEGKGIEVTRFVFLAAFNTLGNLMLSRDLVHPESKEASEFFTAMMGIMEWVGRPNISDLFSSLKWLDLQGLKRKTNRDMGKALEVASALVKERMKEQKDGPAKGKDFLDVLLEFEGNGKDEPDKLSEREIIVFIMEIFLAGTETTSSLTEWALTELLRHPEEMNKAKAEINEIVGKTRKFEESDIDSLPYLCVIKETLRLHPPLPFLVPRKAIHDTEFMGYQIPKDTQVFVNVWAIGRDPECWEEASSFKPERFLGSKIDYKGQHFDLLPFGGGRRICPGISLAHRMMHLVLGSLLHEFDWELEDSETNRTVDMREKTGMVFRKLEPLIAVPSQAVF